MRNNGASCCCAHANQATVRLVELWRQENGRSKRSNGFVEPDAGRLRTVSAGCSKSQKDMVGSRDKEQPDAEKVKHQRAGKTLMTFPMAKDS